VAAAQIDGTNADNIIVGSGPGVPSQVKIYQIPLAYSSSSGPALFATFKPYGEDRSGVSLATGFVDFSTGRESIVTAPGPGSPTEVKVFAFPLLKPIANASTKADTKADHGGMHAMDEPVNTASFTPFGKDYRGGVSLATGWLAGSLGGAKRIIVSKLADDGSVKIFSSGSALDGGPSLYLQSPEHLVTAPNSARSRASSHSADLAARGWRRPVRRPAPICWSAVSRLAARMQASSNTISSGRTRRRRRLKSFVSDKSGPEKALRRASAAIRTRRFVARAIFVGMAAAADSLCRERTLLER
jgi:hypothetical protein